MFTSFNKNFFVLFFLMISLPIIADKDICEIKGFVVNEYKQPLTSAFICLMSGKTIKDSCRAESDGWWGLHCFKPGTYSIEISCDGYYTERYEIGYISGEHWLDTLYLVRKDMALSEVKITAKRQLITSDRRVAYPSAHQKERCSDGATLLGMMQFPNIDVVRGKREVNYWGSGELMFYINDTEATIEQVIAIPPKDVLRIEYIDKPPYEYTRGADVGVVIRYITKKYERGVFNSVMVDKPVNMNSGEYQIENRIRHYDNEYAFNYKGSYDRSHKGAMATNDQIYNLQTGQLRRVDYDLAIDHSVYASNNMSLAFFRDKNKKYLAVNASYGNTNVPINEERSLSVHSGMRNDSTLRNSYTDKNSQNLSAKITYRNTANSKFGYSMNASYGYTFAYNNYNYEDMAGGKEVYRLMRNNDSRAHALTAGVGGWYYLSQKWNISSFLSDYYSYGHDDYIGNYSGMSRNEENTVALQNRLSYRKGSFSNSYALSFIYSTKKNFENVKDNVFYANINTQGRYNFNNSDYLDYYFYLTPTTVSRSSMSTAEIVLNEYQSRRGNPNLKDGYNLHVALSGGKSLKKVDFFLYTDYGYYDNNIREGAILEGDRVIRMPMNFNTHAWRYMLTASLTGTKPLYGSVTIGQNRYWNKNIQTGTSHVYENTYVRLNGTLELGKWDLSVNWWNHNNDFYGESLFTSGRSLIFSLERTWLDGHLSTSLSYENPFKHNYAKDYVRNYSDIAPYTSTRRYTAAHNILELEVIYKFSWGKKTSKESISTGVKASSGHLNSSNTDEQ